MLRFRPLAGCGLFPLAVFYPRVFDVFPSPCGVWVVSNNLETSLETAGFRPLAGCGLFQMAQSTYNKNGWVSVPLRGVGCFGRSFRVPLNQLVSVPLRGVGCFYLLMPAQESVLGFRPLAGCGLFPGAGRGMPRRHVSVPLRGVGCFGKAAHSFWCNRKKNCQLCYFIVSYWQMFINSKLRNCKVPCEAHKTAT